MVPSTITSLQHGINDFFFRFGGENDDRDERVKLAGPLFSLHGSMSEIIFQDKDTHMQLWVQPFNSKN
jgi:hypothetical protein